ncbi:MAG: serine/threonine-protein kinase [Chrysiogenales bacterium]
MIKIGEALGHFLIQAEIGRGGMGTIYFAIDTMLNREVALKAIHPQLADNQQLMDRFKIEAMTQARLNHPNIVTIFSFNKIDDLYIIAMEYVEGKSLKELLQAKKRLSPGEAIAIIIQVAEGLAYAHAHNVIHRDIKPANILLDKDNKVKISDFGIAKVFGAQGLTKTGMMMGTPWYTPPEQIMGKNIDFRADLYSLGVTFYELLTSRVPFDSETNSEFQIQKAHLETPPPRPSIYNPQISVKLEKLVLQALQKKVEKRFQNAGDMIAELKEIHTELSKTGRPVFSAAIHTQILDAPIVKRRRFLPSPLKLASFLILLLVAGILWMIMSGKSSRNESMNVKVQKTLTLLTDNHVKAVAEPQYQPAQKNNEPAGEEKKPTAEIASDRQSVEAGTQIPPLPDTTAEKDPQKNIQAAPSDVKKELPTAADQKDPLKNIQIVPSETKKELPEKAHSKVEGIPVQEQPLPADQLGSLDAELIRLRGFLGKRNLLAANRLADALLQSGTESRVLPLLGNVKFFLNKFVAAEQLWLKSLQANHLVSLELMHIHDIPGEFCLGQLKFKKKIIMFSSDARGDHSFALQADNIKAITMGDDLKITITATINGQEMNESFMLDIQYKKLEKEQFLIDFLNKYVL